MSEVNKERLMSDIKTVLADAEDLLKQAASATGERAPNCARPRSPV